MVHQSLWLYVKDDIALLSGHRRWPHGLCSCGGKKKEEEGTHQGILLHCHASCAFVTDPIKGQTA